MTRYIEEALLFFLPFAVFALYLVARRRNPFLWVHWSKEMARLVVAGLVTVIVSLLATYFLSDREQGAYIPAHMEDGRLVPGQFK